MKRRHKRLFQHKDFNISNINLFKDNPDEVVKVLNVLGVDAYRGATQLNIVEPDNIDDTNLEHLDTFVTRYPHEAKYLIDHVVYLPVNKTVPFHELDKMCRALTVAVASSTDSTSLPLRLQQRLKLQSKL